MYEAATSTKIIRCDHVLLGGALLSTQNSKLKTIIYFCSTPINCINNIIINTIHSMRYDLSDLSPKHIILYAIGISQLEIRFYNFLSRSFLITIS